MTSTKSLAGLASWLLVCAAVAWFGAQFTPGEWYAALTKPSWNPPNRVFGPMWTLLYGMMAIAAWLVWRRGGWHGARVALTLFVIQLVANGLWSWLFFDLHRMGLALADLVLLWCLVALTAVAFWHHRKLAAVLLLPYLAWLAFAGVLNYTLWQLNPAA